mgnify:CR=1 FL=1
MITAWTDDDEAAVREFVEREFRKETPPKHIAATHPGDRVHRALIWIWCDRNLGKRPPMDREYGVEFAKWYRKMALKVIAEQDDAEALAYAKKCFRFGKNEIGFRDFGRGPRNNPNSGISFGGDEKRIKTDPHDLHNIFNYLCRLVERNPGCFWALGTKLQSCEQANDEHAASARQFMHAGHRKNTICYAHATLSLARPWIIGLLVHEFGHLVLGGPNMDLPKHSEQAANEAGEAATGIKVVFKGPLRLEWSDPKEYSKAVWIR